MKTLKAILMICALAFAFTAARADTPDRSETAPEQDLALFTNGDILSGSLAGCDKAGLHWKPAYESQPVLVNTKYLDEVRLRPRKISAKTTPPTHYVILANGDVFSGAIVSLDDESLALDTWYAGRLAITRTMIKSIIASDAFGYRGPTGMDGWVTGAVAGSENTWSCKDGILSNTGAGTIGRDLKLKAPARIQFDLTVRSDSQATCIYVCPAQVDKPGDCYMFKLNALTATIDAARYSPGSVNTRIGQPAQLNTETGTADDPAHPEKYHFEIFVNKEMKTIWLYVNGSLVEQYASLDDLPKMGGGLAFGPDGDSHLEIGKIKVGAWHGGLDEAGRADTGANEDSLEAANRSPMRGKLKGFANGKAVFTGTDGDHEIEVADIGVIRFSATAAVQVETKPDDVRALLLAPCKMTMEFESWDAKGVTVTSPDFGRGIFLPEIFRHLQFDLQHHPVPEGGDAFDIDGGGDDD